MRKISFVLLSALALASSSFGTPIPISALPFNITAPGNYAVTADLNYSGTATAINITPNLTGPVLLNLNGHTLTGSSNPGSSTENYCIGVGIFGAGPSVSSITIENGVITNFGFGVWAEPNNAQNDNANSLSLIEVRHITVSFALTPAGDGAGVLLSEVVSSTVSNCTINSSDLGIEAQSAGGNLCTYNTFTNVGQMLVLYPQNGAAQIVLERCDFEAPAN